jgi:hypothetical protein
MNVIKYSPQFEKDFKRLGKKYKSIKNDLKMFCSKIDALPGIDLGHGYYKYRLAISAKGKGKRSGARVVTHEIIVNETSKNIVLLTMYDKSNQESISKADLDRILSKLNE